MDFSANGETLTTVGRNGLVYVLDAATLKVHNYAPLIVADRQNIKQILKLFLPHGLRFCQKKLDRKSMQRLDRKLTTSFIDCEFTELSATRPK